MSEPSEPHGDDLEAKHADHGDECCYALVCEASQIPIHKHMVGHIYAGEFRGRPITSEKLRLKFDIEDASHLLRDAVRPIDEQRYKEYFTQLLGIAQMGLLCKHAKPTDAAAELEKLKQTIVKQQSKAVRGKHLNRLMLLTFVLAAVFLLCAVFFRQAAAAPALSIEPRQASLTVNCLMMLSAAMVCTWLSFAVRGTETKFDELRDPQSDHLEPHQRAVCVVMETLILALFGHKKLAGVFLGDFSTQRLSEDIGSALIFGIACGLSQRLLSQTIEPIVQSVVHGMRKPAEGRPAGS